MTSKRDILDRLAKYGDNGLLGECYATIAKLRDELKDAQIIGNNLIVENVVLKADVDRLRRLLKAAGK